MEQERQETPNYDPLGAAKDHAWNAIGDIAAKHQKEGVQIGHRVKIVGGRKERGFEGVVFWIGKGRSFDPYPNRYRTDMQAAMLDAIRYDFRCGIKGDDGKRVFTALKNVEQV